MSSTPTSVGIPAERWSVKQYTILVALVLAMVAGVFGAYSLTRSDEAAIAPSTVQIEDGRAGGDGCSASFAVSGGLLEGQSVSDACGGAGGTHLRGGVQP